MSDSDIVANQELVANALNKHLRNKPSHYSRRSRSPYYSFRNAKWIRQYIDLQIATRKDIVFEYTSFNLTPTSLDAKIRQSVQYILDHIDAPDAKGLFKYADWREQVQIRQTARGVVIKYLENGSDEEGTPVMIAPEDKKPIWIRRMENYLEGDNVEPFIMEGLTLSEGQAAEIRKQLNELKGIQSSVTRVSIKIIKV